MYINVELFQKVKAQILAELLAFDMFSYMEKSKESSCGTTQCICGWTNLICRGVAPSQALLGEEGEEPDWLCNEGAAARALRLRAVEGDKDTVWSLFHEEQWPEPYRSRFYFAKDAEDRVACARIAADYIDWICANYGPPAPAESQEVMEIELAEVECLT